MVLSDKVFGLCWTSKTNERGLCWWNKEPFLIGDLEFRSGNVYNRQLREYDMQSAGKFVNRPFFRTNIRKGHTKPEFYVDI